MRFLTFGTPDEFMTSLTAFGAGILRRISCAVRNLCGTFHWRGETGEPQAASSGRETSPFSLRPATTLHCASITHSVLAGAIECIIPNVLVFTEPSVPKIPPPGIPPASMENLRIGRVSSPFYTFLPAVMDPVATSRSTFLACSRFSNRTLPSAADSPGSTSHSHSYKHAPPR